MREPRPWMAANFRPLEWLPEASIDPAISGLLPKGTRQITAGDISTIETWFGIGGRFPAVKVETGEIGI
jgi:hypothetical protein